MGTKVRGEIWRGANLVPDERRASQRRESGKRGGETLTQPSGGGVYGGEELKKLQSKSLGTNGKGKTQLGGGSGKFPSCSL